jgi:nucleoside-diphosphate-sugar epimerase
MPVWMITGGSGFLGGHVLGTLAEEPPHDAEVVAVGRRCPPGWPHGSFVRGDLDDPVTLHEIVASHAPGVVIHAAGQTPPARTEQFFRGNTRRTVELLRALQALSRPVRTVLVGSAAELGPVEVDDLPVGEGHRCRPSEPYGLSKWFATAAGLASAEPLEVMVARVFNPIGPGMSASQAFGRFAERLANAEADPLRMTVGDLESRRDFIDARDVARALIALALRGRRGLVYHVGTGVSHSVGEGLERLIELSGRTVLCETQLPVARPGPRDSRADPRRIGGHTGWAPRIPWEQSLSDLWDEVRRRSRLPLTPSPAPV